MGMVNVAEEIKKIDKMGQVKSLAFRFVDDVDMGLRCYARMEDVDGVIYELSLNAVSFMRPGDETHCERAVVLNHILQKAFGSEWQQNKNLQISDPNETISVFREARKKRPVENPGCINAETARLYGDNLIYII